VLSSEFPYIGVYKVFNLVWINFTRPTVADLLERNNVIGIDFKHNSYWS